MFDCQNESSNLDFLLGIQYLYFKHKISSAIAAGKSRAIIKDPNKVQIFEDYFRDEFESLGFEINRLEMVNNDGASEPCLEIRVD